jgi:hypothetical protein
MDNSERAFLWLIFGVVGMNTYGISDGEPAILILPVFGLVASTTFLYRSIYSDTEAPSADDLETGDTE